MTRRADRVLKDQPVQPQDGHRPTDVSRTPDQRFGVWLTAKQAALYVPCQSVKAFYMWRRRHGLVTARDGTVSRLDIDRIKRLRKPSRVMSAQSLVNLRKRAG